MNIEKLADRRRGPSIREWACFENGRPFYETLSKTSAAGPLKVLRSLGLELAEPNVSSPPIAPSYGEHDTVH
jgi:hypothetical protein